MKIIVCGCSFNYGFYFRNGIGSKTNSWVDFLADKSGFEITNLSLPGCSNYAITKQIEYSLNHNPDLVIFNTTTVQRYEIIESFGEYYDTPTITDFDYTTSPVNLVPFKSTNIIKSMSLNRFVRYSSKSTDYKKLSESIIKYSNESIKKDKDRMFLRYAIQILQDRNINFICLDFADLFSDRTADNFVKIKWEKMCHDYPLDGDSAHWNEQGYKFLAEKIESLI